VVDGGEIVLVEKPRLGGVESWQAVLMAEG
jgi:hypothetical protein